MHNPESVLENETQNSLGFWDTNESFNLDKTTRPSDSQQKKKRICRIVDFAVPVDHRIKLKESEKRDKYLDLTRELKNYGTWKWRWYQL